MAQRPRDVNQLAKQIADIATGESEDTISASKKRQKRKGRAGGFKGGKARAVSLTAEQRHEIAKLAARARWKKQD